MTKKLKRLQKNPLTMAQDKLLKESLRKLLGPGLIADNKEDEAKKLCEEVIRNALIGPLLL